MLNFREDATAFRAFINEHQDRVYNLVLKMVQHVHDAEEIAQDVFVDVYRKPEAFRGEANITTWLYRIASNEAINFLNKKRRKYFIPIYDVENELSEKLEADPDVSGDAIQLKLQKALLKLPEKQRLVFNLKYFEDLPYEEISEITGTSVGALKASYHWASKKIEDFLNDTD